MAALAPPQPPPSQETLARRRRQQALFLGGVTFVVFSSIITRRSLARRYRSAISPATELASTKPPASKQAAGFVPASAVPKPTSGSAMAADASQAVDAASAQEALSNSGPMVALEALGLATLNVFSWAIMATGGALWAFDISSMSDLRRKVRHGMGVEAANEQEADEEIEEWIATVLARKEEKEKTQAK